MLAVVDVGGRRELQAILTVYLSTLLSGYSSGFSAVAVPAMREEVRSNHSYWDIPPVELTEEELSWFGNYNRAPPHHQSSSVHQTISQQSHHWSDGWMSHWWLQWREVWSQEDNPDLLYPSCSGLGHHRLFSPACHPPSR